MSITYPTLTETNFPDEIDSFTRMSDISYADISLVNQYNEYILAGNTSAANQILIDNPSLNNKIMNASNMNKILDALSAIQQFFKNNVQTYIDDKSDVILTEIAKLNLIGEYNSGTQYYKNNVVQYNGEAFICRVDTVGIAPTAHANNTNWGIIAKQGIQGVSGTGLTFRYAYDSGTTYTKDDCVTNDNSIWAALQTSTGQPLIEGSYWTLVITFDTKEEKHQTVSTELLSTGWSGLTQTISVTGVTADNTVFVSPNAISLDDYANAGIICTTQSSNQLTFTCKIVPTTTLTINVVILGG